MARTRSIKPEFWSDEKLAKLSRNSRLTFVGLWSVSDDYGVVKGHPSWLKAQLFPYDDDLKMPEFKKWIVEIESNGMIIPFTHNNETYYFIRHFSDHQKVDHPSKNRNPEPPQDILANVSRMSRDETETETETETSGVRHKKFIPPSIEEISTYCLEHKSTINPEAFFNYYTSNGWMVGKNKMKDWTAAVRTWEAKGREKEPIQKVSSW